MANALLDRYKQIQQNPIGSNTALSPTTAEQGNPYGQMSAAGKQYRTLERSYGRALRILNHAARRGNANAALQSIAVRKEAMGQGFAPGGIRNAKASDANIYAREDSMEKAGADQDLANQVYRKRANEELAGGANWWEGRNRTQVGPTDTSESYPEDNPYDTGPTGTGQDPGADPSGFLQPGQSLRSIPGFKSNWMTRGLSEGSPYEGAQYDRNAGTPPGDYNTLDKWGRKRALQGSYGTQSLRPRDEIAALYPT